VIVLTEMSLADKKKLLGNLVKKTQDKHGGSKHVLSFASDRLDELKYEFIPTPSENLNMALGNGTEPGGWARGKIIEIAGESSSGKTSVALETIGLDHKLDPESIWGWLDTEGDFDEEYAKMKGVDMDRLIIWEVDDVGAEKGLDTLEMLIRSHALKAVVVNSVSGLTPKRELRNEMEKADVALQARMMSKLMRKITAISNRTKTSVIFINQLRENVGQMFGDTRQTTGGRALRFFSTQRITLNKVKLQKEDGITEDEGIKINVKVAKNRAAYDNPYKATSYTAIFGQGIDTVRELAQLAQDAGYATSSSWIYVNRDKAPSKENFEQWNGQDLKFQGKAKFLDFIRNNPDFQEHLKSLLRGNVKVESLSSDEIAALEEEEKALEAELAEFKED
jgi:recombination protein RecA